MYYEDNEVVVHFELRRNYGMIWRSGPWLSLLYYENKEVLVLLVVHF